MSDRQITLTDLQSTDGAIAKDECLRNYRGILNSINKCYGWDQDVLYYDRLNEHAEDLPDICKVLWNITSIASLKQKLSAISSLMTRSRFGKDHNIKKLIRNADRMQYVEVKTVGKKIPDWETDLLPKLKELSKQDGVCGTIAKIFSYGYVLRVGEIFTTTLIDNGISNFLDLDAGKWIVRNQKNGTPKEFDVDPELCKQISRGRWLLRKSDGEQYCKSARTLKYHGWQLPDNHTIRKSYETWNINNSGRDGEQKATWHKILGHTKETAEDYYDHPPKSPSKKWVLKKKLDRKIPIHGDVEVIEEEVAPEIYYYGQDQPQPVKIKPIIKLKVKRG